VNDRTTRAGLAIALIVGAVYVSGPGQTTPTPTGPATPPVAPVSPCGPGGCPVPKTPPAPKPVRPWGPRAYAPVGANVGGPVSPDGVVIQLDLPGDQHLRNKGGSDGAGLCVFTSIDHSARWQNVPALIGFRDWMTRYPGGGYPQKVDQMIAKICTEKGVPKPEYLQVEGADISILVAACKAGLMPAITYGISPTGRYGGSKIPHMVTLVHADGERFVVLDNNYPGPEKLEWMSAAEFKRSYTISGGGWAVILLPPGPPPVPCNRS